jgi:hypothetical protein
LSRTLTELDEWPRHPTIDTFDRGVTDSPCWSDGYWFRVGDPEGAVNLTQDSLEAWTAEGSPMKEVLES